jgi:hypothetical protein
MSKINGHLINKRAIFVIKVLADMSKANFYVGTISIDLAECKQAQPRFQRRSGV